MAKRYSLTKPEEAAEAIEKEIARARRYRRPLSLAIIDVDSLRIAEERGDLNDLAGNVAGDIIRFIRSSDQTARTGARELTLIMPETNSEEAKEAIERVSRQINGDSRKRNEIITLSIGLVAYPDSADNRKDLIREGRLALARAKADGGGGVIVSTGKAG